MSNYLDDYLKNNSEYYTKYLICMNKKYSDIIKNTPSIAKNIETIMKEKTRIAAWISFYRKNDDEFLETDVENLKNSIDEELKTYQDLEIKIKNYNILKQKSLKKLNRLLNN